MATAQIIGFSQMDPSGFSFNIQRSICPANTLNGNTLANAEFSEMGLREAGAFHHGYGRVTSNTLDGATIFNLRLSRIDRSILLTVGASQTGSFEDVTNSVGALADDELDWRVDTRASTSGLLNGTILAVRFLSADTTATVAWAYCGGSGGGTSTASTTKYGPITSTMGVSTTESDAAARIHGAFTSKNLYFEVASNPRTTDTIIRTRINSADGNQTVTVGATQTGVFEDTTHTDSLADGNDYNYSWTTGTGTGTINSRACSTNLVSTARQWVYAGGNVGGAVFSAVGGPTSYASFAGNFAQAQATEADAQVKTFAQTVSKLAVSVSSNNVVPTTGTLVLTVGTRINGANGATNIQVFQTQSGLFEDTTHSDTISDSDLVNLQMKSEAGTGSATVRMVTLLAQAAADAAGGGAIVFNRMIG